MAYTGATFNSNHTITRREMRYSIATNNTAIFPASADMTTLAEDCPHRHRHRHRPDGLVGPRLREADQHVLVAGQRDFLFGGEQHLHRHLRLCPGVCVVCCPGCVCVLPLLPSVCFSVSQSVSGCPARACVLVCIACLRPCSVGIGVCLHLANC